MRSAFVGLILFCISISMLAGATLSTRAAAQGVTVSLRVRIEPPPAVRQRMTASMPIEATDAVVAWLTPVGRYATRPATAAAPAHGYVLAQKNKQFTPHLLVIPTGSSVEFPNLDPFFHNVFSLFNGRRFDLGLYEAGSHRTVRFDHDGISYIFCNIHPEMAAVIVSLSTPYYGISKPDGTIMLANIPPGDYDLSLWSQAASSESTAAAKQRINVAGEALRMPAIELKRTLTPASEHRNKFGEEYAKPDKTPY